MTKNLTRLKWIVASLVVAVTIVTLYAQEPRQENRGINVTQGNVTVSRGYVLSGGNVLRDFRTNTSITGTSPTYTAAQLAAMSGQSVTGTAAAIAAPGNVYLTITSVGAPTAGYVTVVVNYTQLV